MWLYLGVAEGITRCKATQSCFMLFFSEPDAQQRTRGFQAEGKIRLGEQGLPVWLLKR